jgi:hypothetical protein
MTERTYRRGEFTFTEGEAPMDAIIVKEGRS